MKIYCLPTAKYKEIPNDVEKNTLRPEASRKRFNFARVEKLTEKKLDLKNLTKKSTREKNLRSPLEAA